MQYYCGCCGMPLPVCEDGVCPNCGTQVDTKGREAQSEAPSGIRKKIAILAITFSLLFYCVSIVVGVSHAEGTAGKRTIEKLQEALQAGDVKAIEELYLDENKYSRRGWKEIAEEPAELIDTLDEKNITIYNTYTTEYGRSSRDEADILTMDEICSEYGLSEKTEDKMEVKSFYITGKSRGYTIEYWRYDVYLVKQGLSWKIAHISNPWRLRYQ